MVNDCFNLNITSEGANLIYNISSKMSYIKKFISKTMFDKFLYEIANKAQDIFFNRIIMEHSFNKCGAAQVQHDIKYGLFSIFSFYNKNVEYTFSKFVCFKDIFFTI